MTNNIQKDERKFPTARLFIGAALGVLLSLNKAIFSWGLTPDVYWTYWLYGYVLSLIIGFVPMIIAYTRKIKNANKVYWFAFAAMCLPGFLIWFLIALFMAIFGKKKD